MNKIASRTLSAHGLYKSYKGLQVVKGVDLDVSSNEIVGLLGPNGAGKTTTFYMVVGLVPYDSGTILLDNKDIGNLPMHKRAQHGIGYLPQEPSIFRNLSVEDNLIAILELRPELNKQQRQEIANELMGEFNITHKRESLGISLSGGERRRVEIARALATNPSFILLDEPFAGVDPISVGDIQRVIRHLKDRGIGVLITDHNVRETLGICDRAYIVSEGRVLTKGHPDTILTHPDVRAVYLGEDFRL